MWGGGETDIGDILRCGRGDSFWPVNVSPILINSQCEWITGNWTGDGRLLSISYEPFQYSTKKLKWLDRDLTLMGGGASSGQKMGTTVRWGDWSKFHQMGDLHPPGKKNLQCILILLKGLIYMHFGLVSGYQLRRLLIYAVGNWKLKWPQLRCIYMGYVQKVYS